MMLPPGAEVMVRYILSKPRPFFLRRKGWIILNWGGVRGEEFGEEGAEMEGTEIEGAGAGDGLETGRLQNLLESIGLGWVGVEIYPFLFNR